MIVLIDGPAAGEYDSNTDPETIRAVVNPQGERFILDQPHDAPGDDETLYVYRRTGTPFTAALCGRGRTGRVLRVTQYALEEDQDRQVPRTTQA